MRTTLCGARGLTASQHEIAATLSFHLVQLVPSFVPLLFIINSNLKYFGAFVHMYIFWRQIVKPQVDLNHETARNMADEAGNMSKENFLALGTKTKLVDLAGRAEADTPEHTPTKHPHHHAQRRVKNLIRPTVTVCWIYIVRI